MANLLILWPTYWYCGQLIDIVANLLLLWPTYWYCGLLIDIVTNLLVLWPTYWYCGQRIDIVAYLLTFQSTVVMPTACVNINDLISRVFIGFMFFSVSLSGRAVQGVGLRPLVCWDCGFESRRWPDSSLESIVCCQFEVSATGWSLAHRSPTDSDASFYVI